MPAHRNKKIWPECPATGERGENEWVDAAGVGANAAAEVRLGRNGLATWRRWQRLADSPPELEHWTCVYIWLMCIYFYARVREWEKLARNREPGSGSRQPANATQLAHSHSQSSLSPTSHSPSTSFCTARPRTGATRFVLGLLGLQGHKTFVRARRLPNWKCKLLFYPQCTAHSGASVTVLEINLVLKCLLKINAC